MTTPIATPAFTAMFHPTAPTPPRTNPRGRFLKPGSDSDVDPQAIHDYLAGDSAVARLMDEDTGAGAAALHDRLTRLDKACNAIMTLFRNDDQGWLRQYAIYTSQYIRCLHLQISLYGKPGMHAVPLDIYKPIPVDHAVYRTTPRTV